MPFTDSLAVEAIDLNLNADSGATALETLVQLATDAHGLPDPHLIVSALIEREELSTTGIGGGIAVPHCKTPQAGKLVMAVGISKEGIEFQALDHNPVHLFFLLLAPIEAANSHLKALAKIARFAKDPKMMQQLLALDSQQEVFDFLVQLTKG